MLSRNIQELQQERQRIDHAGRLHWIHWAVVLASLLLTIFAWRIASVGVERRALERFEDEVRQVSELLTERMAKYEDALFAGTGAMQLFGGEMTRLEWRIFANQLDMPTRHPGINGIGVIYHIARADKEAFLERQRRFQPDFSIFPEHSQAELMPIAYIEPQANNEAAVGLDMAHETNRYTAAKMARDSGKAQITGPIVLVQDSTQTPGFLFYVPYYKKGVENSVDSRRQHFSGLIYAPFVVSELMGGTLRRDSRAVEVRISDNGDVLFDDWHGEVSGKSFEKRFDLSLYGRMWRMELRATPEFLQSAASAQPRLILIGGLFIDALLLSLFIMLSRANRRAIDFSGRLTNDYQVKVKEQERLLLTVSARNEELTQFAQITAHDLQEPLRTIASFSQLLTRRYKDSLDDDGATYLTFISNAAKRMSLLLSDLLDYVDLGREHAVDTVNCSQLLQQVLKELSPNIDESGARITIGELPEISGCYPELKILFKNLLDNAIKFRHLDDSPQITVTCVSTKEKHTFSVADNGIGIDPAQVSKLFHIFRQLHPRDEYEGSGIGLVQSRKIAELHGGELFLADKEGPGCTFCLVLPID